MTDEITDGYDLFIIWLDGRPAEALRRLLVRAASKDPLSHPREVPQIRAVRRWISKTDKPGHKARRLIAIAAGARIRKDDGIAGGRVPVEAW